MTEMEQTIYYKQNLINIPREELIHKLKQQISLKRFEHVLRVEATSMALAEKYKANVEKASISSLLHDYAKEMTVESLIKYRHHSDFKAEWLDYGSEIWHGPLAAMIAEEGFGVTDHDILNALRHHTIGGINMTLDEKILFIGDYIEPGRTFKDVDQARCLAEEDLDLAVDFKIRQTLKYLVNQRSIIYPETILVYNDWVRNHQEGKKFKYD